jgi:hypothetical protein
LLSVFFLVAVYWVRKNIPSTGFANGLMQLSSLLPEPAQAGFVINTGKGSTLANGHLMMGSYLLVSTLLYLMGCGLHPRYTLSGQVFGFFGKQLEVHGH